MTKLKTTNEGGYGKHNIPRHFNWWWVSNGWRVEAYTDEQVRHAHR